MHSRPIAIRTQALPLTLSGNALLGMIQRTCQQLGTFFVCEQYYFDGYIYEAGQGDMTYPDLIVTPKVAENFIRPEGRYDVVQVISHKWREGPSDKFDHSNRSVIEDVINFAATLRKLTEQAQAEGTIPEDFDPTIYLTSPD